MIVKDLMEEIYVVDDNISLSKAAHIMSSKKVSEIVFVSDGKLKGIITEDDLVRNFDKKGGIKDVMTAKVVVIDESESIDHALNVMSNHSIKRLPVLNKNGKLAGIIRLIDIAKHAEELEGNFFFE